MSETRSRKLSLTIVDSTVEAYVAAIRKLLASQAAPVVFASQTPLADAVAQALRQGTPKIEIRPWIAEPAGGTAPHPQPGIHVHFTADGDALALELLTHLDLTEGAVIAPRTSRHGLDLPLFLISIPKSGTHLLMELARALGYGDGESFEITARPGHWHYVEFSNSHTAAPDFFIDSVRRNPFGNRFHPFTFSPAIFIYRHPLDILVSEANYYHRDGKTAFANYLGSQSFEQRLLRLANDPWLLGSLRDRVGKFAAWLDFDNVAAVSFEELIGSAGGGDAILQRQVIWSLLLKLQVSGEVDAIAARVFNPASPTFEKGAIGSHRSLMTPAAWDAVNALDDDFFRAYGYSRNGPELLSERIAEFRRRPLTILPPVNRNVPILVEGSFLGHNLVLLGATFYAIPLAAGRMDLARMAPEELAKFSAADSLASLKHAVVTGIAREEIRREAESSHNQLRREAEEMTGQMLQSAGLLAEQSRADNKEGIARTLADFSTSLAYAAHIRTAGIPEGHFLGHALYRYQHHLFAMPQEEDQPMLIGHSMAGLRFRLLVRRILKW